MKKFAQTALLVAGLVGLSACASSDTWTPYGTRTAGNNGEEAYVPANADVQTLKMCIERENRLMELNKSCYRK